MDDTGLEYMPTQDLAERVQKVTSVLDCPHAFMASSAQEVSQMKLHLHAPCMLWRMEHAWRVGKPIPHAPTLCQLATRACHDWLTSVLLRSCLAIIPAQQAVTKPLCLAMFLFMLHQVGIWCSIAVLRKMRRCICP